MNDLVNFDSLSFGTHFEIAGVKYIKLKSRTDWMGWVIYYIDDYGNKNAFNAVSYQGDTIHFNHETKVQIIGLPNDKTPLGYSYKTENRLLWNFVELVSTECACQCGEPPFDNGNPCPACFAIQFRETTVVDSDSAELDRINTMLANTEELKKVVDNLPESDRVVESKLKNKHIDTTMKQTFNTLSEAVTAAINELKSTGTLSVHQITTLIRAKTNDDSWEVLDCAARPNGQNIKFWINHDDVRRIVNEMYVNQSLVPLGFLNRDFNGTFMEYRFDTNTTNFVGTTSTSQANVSVPPATFAGAVSSDVSTKTDAYVKSQINSGNQPTLKMVQSSVKVNGVTCEDFKSIVEGLGYKVTAPSNPEHFSNYIVG